MKIEVRIQAFAVFDEVYAALNRDATQARRSGDLERAVALLRQAKAHRGDLYEETRLAKYLQKAGALDEALAEIQWLRDRSAAWAKEMFGHQPPAVRLLAQVRRQAALEAAAALICKRSGRPDLEAAYRRQFEVYAGIRDRMTPVARADTDERLRAAADRIRLLRKGPP
jgi:hypothetical protein